MKRTIIVLTLLLFVFVLFSNNPLFAQIFEKTPVTLGGPQYVPDEIIVKFKANIPDSIINQINAQLGTSLLSTENLGGFKRIKIPAASNILDVVQRYQQNLNVEYAEPNYMAYAHAVPNDPLYGYQWNFSNPVSGSINVEPAWNLTTGAPGIIVAVVDTGVAYEDFTIIEAGMIKRYYKAPDLAQTKFVAGYDFVNSDTHPNDDVGHGTHVTGTIAQSTNNALGTAGIAYNVSIMPVKVLAKNGSGSYADVANGIMWAADHNAKVINLSLGGTQGSTTLQNALAYAYNKGVTIVCSSGNDGQATVSYPAAYDQYCIAVGATRYDETKAYYSNYGSSLDLIAPGGDLNVDQNHDGYGDGILQQTFGNTTNDWGYWFYSGTSMSAPHVSGIAALLLAYGTAQNPQDVRDALQKTAKDLGATGFDTQYGWGLVNAYAALNYHAVVNQPPTAVVGGPYSGTEDIAVTFNGSGSSDPDGNALTYLWNFGDGKSGSGIQPSHTYMAGGTYNVSLIVNDGTVNSQSSTTTATITEVNDAPVATPGGPYNGSVGQAIQFDGRASLDSDGTISAFDWDFGDGNTATGSTASHSYSQTGTYTVSLKVTDNGGATNTKTTTATISAVSEVTVFTDSFEVSEWNGLWTEDAQNDWDRLNQRATNGNFSAEVDGIANNSTLTSIAINLQGKTNARITFSWYIESSLDSGEYIAFQISTDGGSTWVEKARIKGNVDPEDSWQPVDIQVNNIANLKIRFRGTMNSNIEDADVDNVKVVAW